jgi:hypothetical protein
MPDHPSSRRSLLHHFNLMSHIPSGKWSTGALMKVIVPVALELVLFQEVWHIVLMPPVTIVFLTLNLGLFFVLVRPRSWETRIVGMMLGGIAASFALFAYYMMSGFQGDLVGILGKFAREGLENWQQSLGNPTGDFAGVLRLIRQHMTEIEGVVVVIIGVALIWACGRLDEWTRVRWAGGQGPIPSPSIPSPTDPVPPSR